MTREGVIMYAIRLPDGKWWRRGAGSRPAGPSSLKWATLYRNKGAACSAAVTYELEAYEVVKMPLVVGEVVLRSVK